MGLVANRDDDVDHIDHVVHVDYVDVDVEVGSGACRQASSSSSSSSGGEWDLSPSMARAGDETFQEVAQVNPWSSV